MSHLSQMFLIVPVLWDANVQQSAGGELLATGAVPLVFLSPMCPGLSTLSDRTGLNLSDLHLRFLQ